MSLRLSFRLCIFGAIGQMPELEKVVNRNSGNSIGAVFEMILAALC